jgi:hypothetical protein
VQSCDRKKEGGKEGGREEGREGLTRRREECLEVARAKLVEGMVGVRSRLLELEQTPALREGGEEGREGGRT